MQISLPTLITAVCLCVCACVDKERKSAVFRLIKFQVIYYF